MKNTHIKPEIEHQVKELSYIHSWSLPKTQTKKASLLWRRRGRSHLLNDHFLLPIVSELVVLEGNAVIKVSQGVDVDQPGL